MADRPADTISIRYCTACTRTDRFTSLKDRHFAYGKLCDGEVRVAIYRFDRATSPNKQAESEDG